MIKNMVQELKGLGWTFVYIGANQDVDAVAGSLAIENRMNYEYSSTGFRIMGARNLNAMGNYYEKVSRKKRGENVELETGYFDLFNE